jgi:hypothetical protein
MIKTVRATQYITPLREGGSLPAIVEADDGHKYVMKFVGAGQGPKALIAEFVTGEIGRVLGLPVPEIVFMELDPRLGRSEPNLPNAFAFNILLNPLPDPEFASNIVWFDAYATNVDRTARNVNILMWQEQLWLIDHGASLYFHFDWEDFLARSLTPFPLIKDHTLISIASKLSEADAALRPRLTPGVIEHVVELIPDEWLGNEESFASRTEHRSAYVSYLLSRLEASPVFVEEAINAHLELV